MSEHKTDEQLLDDAENFGSMAPEQIVHYLSSLQKKARNEALSECEKICMKCFEEYSHVNSSDVLPRILALKEKNK